MYTFNKVLECKIKSEAVNYIALKIIKSIRTEKYFAYFYYNNFFSTL